MVLGSTDADCRHRTSNYGRTHVAAELRSPDNRCSHRNRWIRRISGAVFTAQGTAQSLVDGCRRSRRRHRTVADVRSRILRQFHRLSSGRRHYPIGLMAYFFTRGIQAVDRRAYMAVDRSGPAYRSRRLVSCIRNQDNGVSNRAHNGYMPYFQRIQQLWRKYQQHAKQTVADIGEKRRDGRKEVARQCLAVGNKSLPLSSL